MGLDSKVIERIIHIRPPNTLSAYYQAVGRAGMSGNPAQAILYYNKSDIGGHDGMEDSMKNYCRGKQCLRTSIMEYLVTVATHHVHACCSVCDTSVNCTSGN